MADDVNANIRIDLDTSQALASLRSLQSQISEFNKSVIRSNATAIAAQQSMLSTLTAQIGATKQFSTSMVNVETSVSKLGRAIDKNKLSLGEYFRYGVASSRTFGRIFAKEHNEVMGLATDRVKRLQTQYIATTEAQNGMTRALAIRPMHLFNADSAIAIQRQQLFNKLLHDGSTSLINWGKNTQWAGRQLMVGFTVPLTIFGGLAGQVFMDLEKQIVNFRRVYGDATTPAAETEAMIEQIKTLGSEFTKYGIAVKDTITLAADAAAAGAQGGNLLAQTEQATRLATLGMMDQQEALVATMALQSAFQMNSTELAESIDFLNAVENQTVLSLQDVATAIPTVAPVIQGLGGDVQDLAIFMAAMREGGINAAEGANALKSGLASLINPTKNAREQLKKVGIDIDAILKTNKGDLRGIVTEFGAALSTLGKFQRQQTLAKVFGKYQFSRLGALFENVSRQGSQAQRVVDLTGQSIEELGQLAEKELTAISDSVGVKFTGALERLKLAIAPIGEAFLKVATPIVEFATKILEKFNELSPSAKNIAVILATGLGVVVPTITMLIGLFANFAGQAIKGVAVFTNFFNRMRSGGASLGYLSEEQLDAAAAAASLEGRVDSLTTSLDVQKTAVQSLTRAYSNYVTAARASAAGLPQGFRTPRVPQMRASGGLIAGTGNKDTEPALLTPGEFVMTKEATENFGPILNAMNKGTVSKYNDGSRLVDFGGSTFETQSSRSAQSIARYLSNLGTLTEDQTARTVAALERLQSENNLTKTALIAALREVRGGIERLPATMVDAHVFEQSQETISGAEARRLAAESGSPITAPASLQKLNAVDVLEQAVPGSTRVLARSDFVAQLPRLINQGLKDGVESTDFVAAFEAAGIEKWGKVIKMSGADVGEAIPQFSLLDRKILELSTAAGRAGLKIADVTDNTRGLISLGDITRQAVVELEQSGYAMGTVRSSIDQLNGRFRTFQVGINSEFIPALRDAGFQIDEVSRISARGRAERLYEISGPGIPEPTAFRTQSQREKAGGSYGNVTPVDFSSFYEQGEQAGTATGRGSIAGLETSTRSQSESREAQRVANDVADGFENQLKRRVPDAQSAGQTVGKAAVTGLASGTSDIRQILKDRLNVGPIVEQEQQNLRETIALRQAENRELYKRAQLISRQGYGPDVAKRMAAEQLAQERIAAAAPPPVVPSGATMLPIVPGDAGGGKDGGVGRISGAADDAGDSMDDLNKKTSSLTNRFMSLSMGATMAAGGLSMMDNEVGNTAAQALPFLGILDALAVSMTMFGGKTGKVTEFLKGFGKPFAAIGTGVTGLFTKMSALFTRIPFVGKFISLFQKLGGVISKVAGLFMRFSGLSKVIGLLARFAAFLGPQGIIAILIAVGVALVGVWNKFQAFRDAVAEIGSSLKELFESLFGPIGELSSKAEAAGNIFSQIWENVLNVVGPVFTVIAKSISIVIKVITIVVQAVKNGIPMIINAFTTLLDNMGPVGDFIKNIGQQISTFFQAIPGAISTLWNGLMDTVGVGINFVIDKVNLLIRAMKAVKLLSEDVSEISSFSMADRGAVSGTVGAGVAQGEASKKAAIDAEAARDRARARRAAETPGEDEQDDGVDGAGEKVKSWLEELAAEIDANYKLFVENVKNSGKSVMDQLRGIQPPIPEQIISAIGAGPDALKRAAELLNLDAKKRKALINKWIQSTIGQTVSDAIGKANAAKQKGQAKIKLADISVDGRKVEQDIVDQILQDENAILTILKGKPKQVADFIRALRGAREEVDGQKQALDELEETMQPIFDEFDRQEALFQQAFGKLERQYEPVIKANQQNIDSIQKQIDAVQKEIDAIEELNAADQQRIRNLDRQKEMLNRQLETLERQNEIDQRKIDSLKREDELRNRIGEALSRDLDILAQQEEKIRKEYQDRISALENVARINDEILQSQKDQLSISEALSSGDIYAATAAAQEMAQNQARFATEQTRTGLETGMENAVESLVTPGGLTRAQAEEQLNAIKEQSYQTSLLIRDIEDTIYQRNLDMIPIKEQQRDIDNDIRAIEDVIYDRESNILNIQNTRLDPLNKQLQTAQQVLSNNEKALAEAKAQVKVDGLTYEQLQNQVSTQKESYNVLVASIKTNGEMRKSVENIRKKWVDVTEQIAAAVRTAKQLKEQAIMAAQSEYDAVNAEGYAGNITPDVAAERIATARENLNQRLAQIEQERTASVNSALASGTAAISSANMYKGGMVRKNYAVGGVIGSGTRDSVPANLAPGEFIVRKSMVDKYGIPMLNSLNQGSFGMPRYNTAKTTSGNVTIKSQNTSNIVSPMYNNYSVNVNVSNTNASADEIANRTIMKIKQMQNMQIRSGRGY